MVLIFKKQVVFAVLFVFICIGTVRIYAQDNRQEILHKDNSGIYIGKISEINSATQGYIGYICEGLYIARREDHSSFMKMLLLDIDETLSRSLDQISAIEPPDDFKDYHEQLRDSYIFHHLANQALLENDRESASTFYKKGMQAYKQAEAEMQVILHIVK